MVNDTLSDVLTRIRNGCLNKSQVVSVPLTRLSQQVCNTLQKEGFVAGVSRAVISSNSLSQRDASFVKTPYSSIPKAKLSQSTASTTSSSDQQTSSGKTAGREELLVKLKYKEITIGGGSKKQNCITNLKRISKPGLRVYTNHKQIPTVLGGLGVLILSTPQGIMTDREARFRKIGGEILCSVW